MYSIFISFIEIETTDVSEFQFHGRNEHAYASDWQNWVETLVTDDLAFQQSGNQKAWLYEMNVSISDKTSCHKISWSLEADFYLEYSDRSEIWQVHRQHCCRCPAKFQCDTII